MKVALEVWSSNFAEVEATCRLAERVGFDGFYYGESPHGLNLECWTTLAALAQATTGIRLGPVIANVLPTYRSSVLLARQAAAVAAISSGRLDFRTGVGADRGFAQAWWSPSGIEYPTYAERLADLRSALERFPAVWAEAGVSIPVTIAARSERAMVVVAQHGDAWETSFCTPDELRDQKRRLDALLGGRQVTTSLEIDGFLSTTNEGLDRLLERVHTDRRAEDLTPVLDRALVGTPRDAAIRLAELARAGVDQVVVALHDPHDPDALHALAETRRS